MIVTELGQPRQNTGLGHTFVVTEPAGDLSDLDRISGLNPCQAWHRVPVSRVRHSVSCPVVLLIDAEC